MDIRQIRLLHLRQRMRQENIKAYIIPTGDYHSSEYVSDYYKVREFYSGFTGSNGMLVVFDNEAGLFTDGRYFIQAERELGGSGIDLYRMGEEKVPTVFEYLESRVGQGMKLAGNGKVMSFSFAEEVQRVCEKTGCDFLTDINIAEELFENRPDRPCGRIRQLPIELTGETTAMKLSRVREELAKAGCDGMFLSRLDDIMWLFNIRGEDVPYNPVALSYAFLDHERAVLFIQNLSELQTDLFMVRSYDEVDVWLKNELSLEQKIAVDPKSVSRFFYELISQHAKAVKIQNPVMLLKAVKNETEIRNLREIYRKDSAAVIKFIYWLKKSIKNQAITEIDAVEYLHRKREEIDEFMGESFQTISAYRANAAMMHYEPVTERPVTVLAEGMLLVDSGGQYLGGTTDVTRTIVLGEISDEEKLHFTKVAAGMLRLSAAKFPEGCTGRNLDILARQPLWELGIDYKCGTGHGIGYMLNVHEDPQAVRWKPTDRSVDGILKAGMLLSNEPGVYIENGYGIRTENVLLVREDEKTADGQFLSFETLTFVPIDLEAVDVEKLDERDKRLLNEYHRSVYKNTSDLLTEEEAAWLREAVRPVV